MKFECLPGCGLCCSYKVALLPGDAERIEGLGYQQGYFASEGALQKDKDFCAFLDGDRRCSIYSGRPGYCRSFPFYLEDDGSVDVDLSCPGLGRGPEITPAFEYPAGGDIDKRTAGRLPGYLPFEKFRKTGSSWCTANSRHGSLKKLVQSARTQARRLNRVSSEELVNLFDIADGMNTHLSEGGVDAYPFILRGDVLVLVNRLYPLPDEEMPAECLAEVMSYAQMWFERYVFYRFCLACSAGMPTVLRPMGVAFQFMTTLIERVSGIRAVLNQRWKQDDMESLREAIRAVDGRLRTKCRAAKIQII